MYQSYLVLFNISKKQNLGRLIRTADALGVSEIVVVGRKRFITYGHFDTDDRSKRKHYYTLNEAVHYLKLKNCEIIGIEITSQAIPVEAHPFSKSSAFLVGNEGQGLTESQQAYCDRIVYIKQYGQGASLNVNVAAGIVLHHFAIWAQYPQNLIVEQKFLANYS